MIEPAILTPETTASTNGDDDNECHKDLLSDDTVGYPAITDDTECSPDNPYDQALSSVDQLPPAEEEDEDDQTCNVYEEEEENPVERMDRLLYSCFMTALKTKLKDKDLPVLASTFYRQGA